MNTQGPSFYIGLSSVLQVTRTIMKAWMTLNFGQIRLLTTELVVIGRLKINL